MTTLSVYIKFIILKIILFIKIIIKNNIYRNLFGYFFLNSHILNLLYRDLFLDSFFYSLIFNFFSLNWVVFYSGFSFYGLFSASLNSTAGVGSCSIAGSNRLGVLRILLSFYYISITNIVSYILIGGGSG